MHKKRALPLAIAMASILPPTAALAQAGEPARRMIDEVVVTAQKREESIQDIPVAVTALSELQLERGGVQDIRDLPTLSASFNMNGSQTESQGSVFRIRGVGTTGNNIGLESAVGVFFDGVHLSRPGIALGDLFDVEAIEVLRGPQGTLFGRNTSAGALVVRTKRPDLDNVEAWMSAGFGNFSSVNLQAGGNLPLIDNTLAVRGAVAVRQQNGFMKSETGAESMDRDRVSLRGQALWNINDRADLRLILDYADADEQCCDALFRTDPINQPGEITGLTPFEAAGLPADGGAPNVGGRAFNNRKSNAPQFENPFEQWGISAELNWDFDRFDLTYIGSYRYFDAESVQFSDFVGIDVFSVRPEVAGGQKSFDEIETTTHELRLAGDTDRFQWMIGGFFAWEDIVEGQGLGLGRDFSANNSANLFALLPDPSLMPVVLEDLVPVQIPGANSDLQFDGSFLTGPDPARAFTGGVDPFGSFARNRFNQTSRSWSIFTHNTLRVTDDFDLVFGLRWVDEDKDGSFEQFEAANSAACLNAQDNAASFTDTGAEGFANTVAGFTCFPFVTPAGTGRPGLPSEFDLNFSDDELVWTVRGIYRFNPDVMGYASFTHGFKAGGFNLDATAAALGPDGQAADPRFDSETIDAWEVGVKADLLDNRVRVNTALFYQDIDDFQVLEFTGVQFVTFNVPKAESKGVEVELQAAPMNQLDLNLAVTYQDAKYPGNCDGGVENPVVSPLCGNRLTNASDWVGVASLTWEDRISGTDLVWFAHTNVRAESKRRTSTQFVDPDSGNPREIPFQGSNTKVNARLGIGPSDERWAVEIWGNNLTEKQTTNNTFNVPLRGIGSLDTPARASFIEAPRTFGATFRARF